MTEAAEPNSRTATAASPPYLLPISTDDPGALPAMAREYLGHVEEKGASLELDRLFAPTGPGVTHHRYRRAVLGQGWQGLAEALRELVAAPSPPAVAGRPLVVFMFAGQGAQRDGMTRELFESCPRYAELLTACSDAVQAEAGWSVVDLILGDESTADRSRIQPALWAVQVSLAKLWQDWGIGPDVVIGYSVGEVAGAVVTGALTVREGAMLVCRRSSLLQTVRAPGDMWAVGLGERAAWEAIGELADQVCVAAVNTDGLTTLAGDSSALETVVLPLRQQGVFSRKLNVSGAGHSHHVEPVLGELVWQLADLAPHDVETAMYSTALDRFVGGGELTAAYWLENVRRPVRFASACTSVLPKDRRAVLVEVGARPVLAGAAEDNVVANGRSDAVLQTLGRDEHELRSMLANVGMAYELGCSPAWGRLYTSLGWRG